MSSRQGHGLVGMTRPEPEPVSHPGYRPATGPGRPDMCLSASLLAQVSCHVLRHYVPEVAADGAPGVLVVQGPFGEGKTSMIAECVHRMGHDCLQVAAGELEETGRVGAPVAALKELEETVRVITAREGRPLVVHFPDFDQSSLSVGPKVETSVNSQLGRAYWQWLIDFGGFKTATGVPAPIIVDGNDFTEMRGSVLRPGRAEFFTLAIEADERAEIVAAMFGVAAGDVRRLIADHKDQPIAFFRDLKVKMRDEELAALYQAHGFDVAAIGAAWQARRSNGLDIDKLRALARRAALERPRSFLNGRR